MEQAIFAAGCFWAVQHYFDQIPGITRTMAGFTGGEIENPTFEEVSSGSTGHAEGVLIEFDASRVSYETLVRHFFRMHDPTQLDSQGKYIGTQFRSAIFYVNDSQRDIAEKVMELTKKQFSKPIMTQVVPAGSFYEAELYLQKYVQKTGKGAGAVTYKPI